MVILQSGNIYRAVVLKKNFRISYTQYISAFSSFAWMDASLNLILATIFISLYARNLLFGKYKALSILIILTTLVIIAPFIADVVLSKLIFIKRRSKLAWVKSKLDEVVNTAITNLKDFKYMFFITFFSIISLVRTVLIYYILFRSFGVTPEIHILVVLYSIFKLGAFFAITPGNIGVQEIAFGFLSEYAGIGMANGILVSTIGRIIGALIILILGIIFGGLALLKHKNDFQKSNINKS